MFFKGMGSPGCRSNTITSTNLLFSYLLTNRELLKAINASYGITRFAAKLITGLNVGLRLIDDLISNARGITRKYYLGGN